MPTKVTYGGPLVRGIVGPLSDGTYRECPRGATILVPDPDAPRMIGRGWTAAPAEAEVYWPPRYRGMVLAEPGLIGYWPMDDVNGQTFTDLQGARSIAASEPLAAEDLDRPSLTVEQGDAAYRSFTGGILGVPEPGPARSPGLAPFTAELWCTWTEGGTGSRYPFACYGNDPVAQGWYLRHRYALDISLARADGGTVQLAMAAVTMTADAAYHLAGTFDGRAMRLYLNGQLIAAEAPVAPVAIGAHASSLHVGHIGAGQGRWQGILQHLAVYDRALPADRVAAHHRLGAAAP